MPTRTISIHSYRGGTGKSNITANVAARLARHGKRVCIVDTDIQSPGIHALFGVDPRTVKHTLNDYLWGRCAVEDTAVDVTDAVNRDAEMGGLDPVSGGVFLIPSSLRAGEIARIIREGYDVNALNDGFREIGSALDLDYLLIDTHPGVNEETLLSIAVSDCLFIVLRPDVQDYQGTAVALDLARRLEVPQLYLVINKAIASLDFTAVSDRVFATYKSPVAAVLPLSEDLILLGSDGLASERQPDGPFAAGIGRIVERIEEGAPSA
ncbi:MinD/ParA family ATP-binding protein [Amorphus orientalis]|uniref:MinD-like ATPase involved in chromosome partitioning or flagellar assembly n=1 Tax=Amorphus orientalis TaxID=649198 RepID=A0AAE3VKT3_9HYPH|nr:MinD/ParA family protein [Amorphus orientalis]MDQ0314304.1 MinD-like ATPase involved in chromosome partitioning or flagellar assembly [Amorphus orientalis]